MKEKFRNKYPKGPLKTKYKIDEGTYDYWEVEDVNTVIKWITDVVDEFTDLEIRLTKPQER